MHWTDYSETEGPVFSDHGDRYGFYGLHELAIEIVEQGDGGDEDLALDNFPKRFFECSAIFLSTEVFDVALRLFEGRCPVTIVEGLIEDLYDMTGLDYPKCSDLTGLAEFEASLSHFSSANSSLWESCRDIESFDPGVQSVGIEKLQAAIDKFSKDNKAIGVWDRDEKKPIELDNEFWLEILQDTGNLPVSDRS